MTTYAGVESYEEVPRDVVDRLRAKLSDIGELVTEAVQVDGDWHKQWFLEQIAERLGISLPDHEEGIAP